MSTRERLRLEAYHKLSANSGETKTKEDLNKILDELQDRFGSAPQSVINLIEVTALRQQANRLGVKELTMLGIQTKINPVELTPEQQVKLSHEIPSLKYLQTSKTVTLLTPKDLKDQEVIDYTWTLLAKIFTP